MRAALVFMVIALAGCDWFAYGVFGEIRDEAGSPAVDTTIPPEMAVVPGGLATFGCQAAIDPACQSDENPPYAATLSPYALDRLEVTIGDYGACVQAGACGPPSCDSGQGALPVRCVSWTDAAKYCAFVHKRLPTEAEWEHAARLQDTVYPWGNEPADCAHAQMAGCPGTENGPMAGAPEAGLARGTQIAGLAGGVAEWVADWYESNAYEHAGSADPQGPASGAGRVVRGGSFGDAGGNLRSTARAFAHPEDPSPQRGFRCAKSVPPPASE